MIRDMNLVREILLQIESQPYPASGYLEINVEGRTDVDIAYHGMLLTQAGLIIGRDVSAMNSFEWEIISLTWHGHEFLDAARDDGRWRKAVSTIRDRTGGLSFELLKQLLIELMKTALG